MILKDEDIKTTVDQCAFDGLNLADNLPYSLIVLIRALNGATFHHIVIVINVNV